MALFPLKTGVYTIQAFINYNFSNKRLHACKTILGSCSCTSKIISLKEQMSMIQAFQWIFCVGGGGGNKSPVQKVFPKIAWVIYCLPQGFWECCVNFVILQLHFLYWKLRWYIEERHILQIWKWLNSTKKTCRWNSKTTKTKNYVRNYIR